MKFPACLPLEWKVLASQRCILYLSAFLYRTLSLSPSHLLRVCEAAHPLKFKCFDKRYQLNVLCSCLAREACMHSVGVLVLWWGVTSRGHEHSTGGFRGKACQFVSRCVEGLHDTCTWGGGWVLPRLTLPLETWLPRRHVKVPHPVVCPPEIKVVRRARLGILSLSLLSSFSVWSRGGRFMLSSTRLSMC